MLFVETFFFNPGPGTYGSRRSHPQHDDHCHESGLSELPACLKVLVSCLIDGIRTMVSPPSPVQCLRARAWNRTERKWESADETSIISSEHTLRPLYA